MKLKFLNKPLFYAGQPTIHTTVCVKNIRSNFSLHILSYIQDIAIPTKDLSQICDIFNQFRDILAQLTSNLFTRTVNEFVAVSVMLKTQ